MILADKIIENRKKNGWSQEELADKLGVSRQSVSKWEGAQAVPDMKKIIQMSEIFGVSTDYLLKDEITVPAVAESLPVDPGTTEDEAVKVPLEEASEFLEFNEKAAGTVSTGVMLCILSPIILITLGGLADAGKAPVSEFTAGIGGVVRHRVWCVGHGKRAQRRVCICAQQMDDHRYHALHHCGRATAYDRAS